jgi:hypothetical protein
MQVRGSVRISPPCLTLTGRTPGRVGGNALWVVAVFSCGDGFDIEPGPGFFVPALRGEFYPAGKYGTKKGGVDDLGKLRSVSGVILTFVISSGWTLLLRKRYCLNTLNVFVLSVWHLFFTIVLLENSKNVASCVAFILYQWVFLIHNSINLYQLGID